MTKWNYSNDILLFAIAAPVWASWSPADQKIVREAALDAARQQVALVRKLFAEYVVRVSALGVAVHVPTLPEMEAWQIAARRPYARYQAQTEPQLVAKIEEVVAKTRKTSWPRAMSSPLNRTAPVEVTARSGIGGALRYVVTAIRIRTEKPKTSVKTTLRSHQGDSSVGAGDSVTNGIEFISVGGST